MLCNILAEVRRKAGLTQEKIADELGVSRQAYQKWELGTSMPSIEKLTLIAKRFNLSLDYLLLGLDTRGDEERRVMRDVLPDYNKWPQWEAYSKTLNVEYRQSIDEGKDIAEYENVFKAVNALQDGKTKDELADILYRVVQNASRVAGYKYNEPSDMNSILALRDGFKPGLKMPGAEALYDKIYGGWLGRVCGCFFGKPIEGIHTVDLNLILKRTDNYPIHRYIVKEDITDSVTDGIKFPIAARAYPKNFNRMPPDDDTNYVLIAYELVKKYGRDFTSDNVMNIWVALQPKNAYCTAERVAYRNFVNGFCPPESAHYKNPYREWIGAQIRGDYFGYINPNDPDTAADMAFRDACISHTKNGIYGEMFISAMIAAAFGTSDIQTVIRTGLSRIPKTSRLYESIENVVSSYNNGVSCADFMSDFNTRRNECSGYDWCHTISNAELVIASILYGNMDYGKSICISVSQGFDTDCNAATVGSILGVMLGASRLPSEWTSVVNDTLESNVFGISTVSIKDMAKKTLAHLKK